jgi:hypothetical protein
MQSIREILSFNMNLSGASGHRFAFRWPFWGELGSSRIGYLDVMNNHFKICCVPQGTRMIRFRDNYDGFAALVAAPGECATHVLECG